MSIWLAWGKPRWCPGVSVKSTERDRIWICRLSKGQDHAQRGRASSHPLRAPQTKRQRTDSFSLLELGLPTSLLLGLQILRPSDSGWMTPPAPLVFQLAEGTPHDCESVPVITPLLSIDHPFICHLSISLSSNIYLLIFYNSFADLYVKTLAISPLSFWVKFNFAL